MVFSKLLGGFAFGYSQLTDLSEICKEFLEVLLFRSSANAGIRGRWMYTYMGLGDLLGLRLLLYGHPGSPRGVGHSVGRGSTLHPQAMYLRAYLRC